MKPLRILFLLVFFSTPALLNAKWTLYKTDPVNGSTADRINCFAVEGDDIWCGTSEGVVKWNRKTMEFVKYTTDDRLSPNTVLSIAIDRNGTKWFGHSKDGITSFDGKNWTRYSKETVPAFNTQTTYFEFTFEVEHIAVDSDTLYFSAIGWNYKLLNKQVLSVVSQRCEGGRLQV